MSEDRILDTKAAAYYLGIQPQTLMKWRMNGVSPEYIMTGYKMVRYRLSVLDAWIAGHGVRYE